MLFYNNSSSVVSLILYLVEPAPQCLFCLIFVELVLILRKNLVVLVSGSVLLQLLALFEGLIFLVCVKFVLFLSCLDLAG